MKQFWRMRGVRWGMATLFLAGTGICTLTAQTSGPAGTNSLTVEEAVRLALANSPALKIARARLNAAAGRAEEAPRWPNPELELRAEEWSVSRSRGFSEAKHTIGIVQTLPYPGKKALDKQLGGGEVKLSEMELALRRTELVRDVKAGFYHILALEKMIAVATQLVAVAESSALTAHRRVEAGAAVYQEQLRAEVQLEEVRAEGMALLRELAIVRQKWATLLGQPELTNAPLAGVLAEVPDNTLVDSDSAAWLERHPSAMAARLGVEQARLAHRRVRLEAYPDVKVSLAGGRMGEVDEGIIELGFSLPLPLMNRGKGRQQEALAQVQVAEAELQRVRQQLQLEWASAQQRRQTAAAQASRYREQILPRLEKALRLVQEGFEEGKFNLMDLLDTQRTAAEARRAYWQQILELHFAQAELEALLRPQAHPQRSDQSSP